MPPSSQPVSLSDAESRRDREPTLRVELANTPEDILAAQRLRYRVFVEKMGARINCERPGIESDAFDPYCRHLLVRERESNQLVGCCRILTDTQMVEAGEYYSQTEFDLTRILAIPGRFMEVGRTCVHPDYRNGAAITFLWNGLARYIVTNRIDYLIGSAGIPLELGTKEAAAVYHKLSKRYLAPSELRTYPRVPLPPVNLSGHEAEVPVPPLIKAYLRVGAKICGEPAWDPHFNVADLFMLLRADDITRHHAHHFINWV